MGERVAVVTGGTGALGRGVVSHLLAGGWRVRVPWVVPGERDALAAESPEGAPLELSEVDVTDARAVASWLGAMGRDGGAVDAVCNLVGGFAAGGLGDTEPRTWDRMLALNATTAFLVTRAALPLLRAGGGGAVVNVTALPAVERGAAGMAAYAASKAAVLSLTHSLSAELRGDGIRVNAVAPEIIDTEANRAAMPDADRSSWLTPAEIARVVAFLVGGDAAVVTGSVLTLMKGAG